MDRTRIKLAEWRLKSLSRVAQSILVKTTLSTIPVYAMQTVKLPSTVLEHLERLACQFFWGSTNDSKVMHTIAWHKICCPKSMGGLGLPKLESMNLALLAKLAWKLGSNHHSLSNHVLQVKYGGWQAVIGNFPSPHCSSLWRSILQTTALMHG